MSAERWQKFTKSQQMLFLGSELQRAAEWQNQDREKFLAALERGLALLDLTLDDPKWRDSLPMILGLREEMTKLYIGANNAHSPAELYAAI